MHHGLDSEYLPRKQPRQARSKAMVARLLDSASVLLMSEGWPAFTTNAVAARAGVDVASLYQYFPNKEALLVALAQRNFANFETLFAGLLPRCDALPLSQFLLEFGEQVLQDDALRFQMGYLQNLMDSLPAVEGFQRQQAEARAQGWMRVLIAYGSELPKPQMREFCRLFDALMMAGIRHVVLAPDAHAPLMREWLQEMALASLRSALPQESAVSRWV